MFSRIVKTAVFSIVAPGTVGILLPQALGGAGGSGRSLREIPGVALFALGVAVYLWCAWDFVSEGLGTPAPIDAPRVLVVQGLYRFTRNPMYVGVLAMIFGQALAYRSKSISIYGSGVLGALYLFVLVYEEPTLRRLFGSEYEEYCRRVPRWLLPIRRK